MLSGELVRDQAKPAEENNRVRMIADKQLNFTNQSKGSGRIQRRPLRRTR